MKQARLSTRLPARVLKESKIVARRQKVTLSALIQRLLEEAIEADQRTRGVSPTIDAEQI